MAACGDATARCLWRRSFDPPVHAPDVLGRTRADRTGIGAMLARACGQSTHIPDRARDILPRLVAPTQPRARNASEGAASAPGATVTPCLHGFAAAARGDVGLATCTATGPAAPRIQHPPGGSG